MTAPANNEARLFEGFVDPVDMIGCFPASMSLGEINAAVAQHGLRFPLVIDPDRTLPEHLEVAEYAPASARFGPYVDNVLGMNWQLPSGQVVRIGERVVKSTTGYDLQRFFLHSGERYGRPRDIVLRLRPVGGALVVGRFTGRIEELERLQAVIRKSSWSHWMDCVDFVITRGADAFIGVTVDCQPGEEFIFVSAFEEMASQTGASFSLKAHGASGLPTISIKCLPGESVRIARHYVNTLGGEARVLVQNGVVLLRPDKDPGPAWLGSLGEDLAAHGGHVSGKSLQLPEAGGTETGWIRALEERWAAL
jgi:hypothetical protein